jgi:hypothetical protein
LTKISGTDNNNNNNVGATCDSLFIQIIYFEKWCKETQATECSSQDAA